MLKLFLSPEALCEFHKNKKVIASYEQDSKEFTFEININMDMLTYVEVVKDEDGDIDPYKVSIQKMSGRQRSMH